MRSLILYLVPTGRGIDRGHTIVTDHGERIATIEGITPDMLAAHTLAERTTRASVKLVAPIETVSRYGGVPLVRVTEDHDDTILTRLIRMIHG